LRGKNFNAALAELLLLGTAFLFLSSKRVETSKESIAEAVLFLPHTSPLSGSAFKRLKPLIT
jgi:hypothetical protein